MHVDTLEWVVLTFLDEVYEGDPIGAKRFWEREAWNTCIERLINYRSSYYSHVLEISSLKILEQCYQKHTAWFWRNFSTG
jgi:hypothetical protein